MHLPPKCYTANRVDSLFRRPLLLPLATVASRSTWRSEQSRCRVSRAWSERERESLDLEANKGLVRRYVEMWETGNVALADEVLAAAYVDHTHPDRVPGPEGVKQEVLAFRAGFPDAHITIEQMISEGDTVAFRFVLRGTHQGTFAGFAPT